MSNIRSKSVSAKKPLFKRITSPVVDTKTSLDLSPQIHNNSMSASKSTVIRSKRKRNSRRNLSDNLMKSAVSNTIIQNSEQQVVANINKQPQDKLPTMSHPGSATSVWLLRLHNVYRYSSFTAFFLVVASLIVYGWTVYSQELWSKSYSQFKNLQSQEQQLKTTNATLNSKMAQEGEAAGKKLVTPTSQRTIFLPFTPTNSQRSTPNADPKPPTYSPLGY